MTSSPRPSDRRVQTVCLMTLTLIAIGFSLAELQPVLVPFVLALFLSQCLAPLILVLMRRARLPRFVAVTVAVAAAAGALTAVGFVIAESVGGHGPSGNRFETYQTSLDRMIQWATTSAPARFFGLRPDGVGGQLIPSMKDAVPYIGNTIGQVAGLLSHSASVLLLMAFLLYGRRWDPDTSVPAHGSPRLVEQIEARVQQYISVTVAISVLTGLLVGAALAALDVQFAAVFGLLAFLLTFIPNFGGVIATLLPLPVVVLDPHLSIVAKVLAMSIPAGIQALVGSFLQPRMTGQSLDLHPVVILLSLLFFTMIWGVGGAFLAVPLTAVIKIVFERIPNTQPLAAVLAGNLGPLTDTIDSPAVEAVTVVREERVVAEQPRRGSDPFGGAAEAHG